MIPQHIREEIENLVLNDPCEIAISHTPFSNIFELTQTRDPNNHSLLKILEEIHKAVYTSYMIYETLVKYGFSNSFAFTIKQGYFSPDTGPISYYPFTEDDLIILNNKTTRSSFLKEIKKIHPFLYQRIRNLEQNMGKTQMIMHSLKGYGIEERIINMLCYKSGRPVTEMKRIIKSIPLLVLPESQKGILKFPSLHRINSPLLICDPNVIFETMEEVFFPVVRYGSGHVKGGYHSVDTKRKFGGTFYYYEKDSNIFLRGGSSNEDYLRKAENEIRHKTLFAPNKFVACAYLIGKEKVVELMESDLDDLSYPTDKDPHHTSFKNDEDLLPYSSWSLLIDDMMNLKYNFLEHNEKMYAREDRLDQVLWRAGRSNNISTMIFIAMTGGSRVVSEIFDLRDREESFDSLLRVAH